MKVYGAGGLKRHDFPRPADPPGMVPRAGAGEPLPARRAPSLCVVCERDRCSPRCGVYVDPRTVAREG